ncbi:hypothetical protein L3Y34_019365 [Caenorhabditis briggsae]|uniref:Uncharacterized protein n=1 Tax=Caenorhabditis briggsae TaxID=6238 RepID=A0AAE9DNH3_CAEBR|nr:hypothetical protein L3Y34_019365 [Caenorhabditis briggsae]
MTISNVSPKKPNTAFPKLPDDWMASLYRELDSGSLEFPAEDGGDVEVVETSGTDDDVTKELSLDNLIVAEAKIGAPELSVLVEEPSEDVSEAKEGSEDVGDKERDSEDVAYEKEETDDVGVEEEDSEAVSDKEEDSEDVAYEEESTEGVTDAEKNSEAVIKTEGNSEDVTDEEDGSEDVTDEEEESEDIQAGDVVSEADHNDSENVTAAEDDLEDVADEEESSEDVTVAEEDSEAVSDEEEDSEDVTHEDKDFPSDDVAPEDVAPEDVDVSFLDRVANEIILKQLYEESEALKIQIPADKAVDISAEDPPAPPMYIQRMQNLLHQQIRRFLSQNVVLQCQKAAENAKIALENQKNLDWNELTASAMSMDSGALPTRFQSQFLDFQSRFSALKAHNLIIQCQNASRRALEEIPEHYSEWDSEATWDSEETLLIRLEADFKLPDEIERLKDDIHVAIDTYKALLLVPESQMSSQNARLPLASCRGPNFNLTSKSAEFPLKTSEILPESMENELESLSEQFEAFRRLQMVVMGQKASESAKVALESAESAEIGKEDVEPESLMSEPMRESSPGSSSSDSVDEELPAIQEAARRRRALLAYQDLNAFYNYSQGAGFFDDSAHPVYFHMGHGLTLVRHVNPIHRHVADRNARNISNPESEEEDSVD